MSRRSRQHTPPRQSIALPPGAADLRERQQQEEANRAQHEAMLRHRVDTVASMVYAQIIDPDCPESDFEIHCSQMAKMAVDAALVFMREVWGVQGQRVVQAQQQPGVAPPQPIIEE